MKTMILGILLLSSTTFGQEVIRIMPKVENYRCTYISPEHSMVVHHFAIQTNLTLHCEYAIEVNEKPFKHFTAKMNACEDFIRSLINRGSVCISNRF